MRKTLFIVGVTASGKTSLALKLAGKFHGEIVAADSRQVYRGMDIGTGKDIPKGFEFRISNFEFGKRKIPFYGDGTKIWGYDLVNPDEEFSLAHFNRIAGRIISDIRRRRLLPIIVGGTGLYFRALTEPLPEMNIPPNKPLRRKLELESLNGLQIRLQVEDPARFSAMNESDRNNPRRLIRAIEIVKAKKSRPQPSDTFENPIAGEADILWIGLRAPRQYLNQRIDHRVETRIAQGQQEEVKRLLSKGYSFNLPAMSGLGYQEWKPFFEGKSTLEEVIQRWKLNEHAYARRQLTWFVRNSKIHWFDISEGEVINDVVELVKEWYSDQEKGEQTQSKGL